MSKAVGSEPVPPGQHMAARWAAPVLAYLDEHASDVVRSLSELVHVPSISGSDQENTLQSVLANELAGSGLDVDHWQIPLAQTLATDGFPGVEVDRREAWGLVGLVPGSGNGQSLMLNCHVDVVPPGDAEAWAGQDPFSGAISDGLVHGRGACDMKGGLVAALWALRALAAVKVRLAGDVLLACVQGEEDGGLGTFAMLDRGWRADACVIPEPTSLDLVPACAGALTFRLRVRGLSAHASRRRSGVSAVEKFWPIFSALRELEASRNDAVHPLMERWDIAYPIEIGRVMAGDWSSSVPGMLIAEGRLGAALDEVPQDAKTALENAVAAACACDPWLREHPVTVEWWGGQFAPGLTDPDDQIISALRRAHSSVSTHTQHMWGAPYGSDLRLMAGLGGVPTVHYGPGDVRLAHGPREHVPIAEVLTTAHALAMLALQYCSDLEEPKEA